MALPLDVHGRFGYALSQAQMDDRDDAAKVLRVSVAQGLRGMQKRIIEGVEIHRGSSNVFADLGLPDAERLKIKSGLVIEIKVRPAAEPIGHLTLAPT